MKDEVIAKVFVELILSLVILTAYLITVWTYVKNKIYSKLHNTKISYWRFGVLSIIWNALVLFVFMTIELLLFNSVQEKFEYDALSRYLLFGVLLVMFIALYWATIAMFSKMATHGRVFVALKEHFRSYKFVHHWVIPIVVVIVVLLLLNLVFFVFLKMGGTIFLVLTTFVLIGYGTWIKFYYLAVERRFGGQHEHDTEHNAGIVHTQAVQGNLNKHGGSHSHISNIERKTDTVNTEKVKKAKKRVK
jgi:hypothetical protein